jgi:membrane protein DedA with SNARE-associated domain
MALPDVQELARTLGPFAAFVAATFDRSGLPLIVGSVCVAVGIAGGNPSLTIALGSLGMIAGDFALFEIGRRGGPRTAFMAKLLRPLKPLRATARAILRKRPGLSLVFGRYVAGAGILIPMLAGAFGHERRRAYALLAFGSILYVVPWGALAFVLGDRFQPVVERVAHDAIWFAVAGIVGVVGWIAYQRVRRKAKKAATHPRHVRE